MKEALYVHIPFCDSICSYCDFARVYNNEDRVDAYLKVLETDILSKDLTQLKTIYIGGGTPSALNLRQLRTLFELLEPYTKELIEYTIEINPESLDQDKASLMSEYGINRASLGMQVTQNNLLKIINRKHTIEEVSTAIDILKKAGIHNISVDLMYGIPEQTLENVLESIKVIHSFDITHVSLYSLTIEPDSAFGRLGYKEVDRNLDASMYEESIKSLKDFGFNRYEISNFSKKGYESKHNKYYWRYDDFIGVGLHASGKEDHKRYTNTRNIQEYLEGDFNPEIIDLTLEDEMFEYIMMNLRLSEGMSISKYNEMFNLDFYMKHKIAIDELKSEGLIIIEDDNIRASDEGLELLFDVLERFME